MIHNEDLIRVLHQALLTSPALTWFHQSPVILRRDRQHLELTLSDEQGLSASLLVGADGGHSWVREHCAMRYRECPYDQQAWVATLETEKRHQQTGWQVFLPTGPLALLPLHDAHCCSLVWSNDEARSRQLEAMSATEFECELNNAFGRHLGYVKVVGERCCFPLVMRHAQSYVDQRVALVGDAAHTIHPLAGQGANLGFMDVMALVNSVQQAQQRGRDIGASRVLGHYQRARRMHNGSMIELMQLLRDVFAGSRAGCVQLRSQGLSLLDAARPLKRRMMREMIGSGRGIW